jgi:hypothetical protein
VIEIACTIGPMCGLSFKEIMWELPAAVAYQMFNFALQMRGLELIKGPSEAELLERLKRWQT